VSQKPLDGIRVIDLAGVWAGPFATMLLADLGAEIIKPENPFVWQPMTRGGMARPTKQFAASASAWAGGYPHGDPGPRPWNYNPTFVSLYRNKKSFATDLRTPEGHDVLRRLVEVSDVLYENNATGTMEKLGITWEWLQEVNPRLIYVRVPAYGSTGPYAYARALGVHLEAVMGHTLLRGYDDADPSSNTAIFSGDYLAGTQGAFAVMASLWRREKTGKGELIEIGQAENASPMFTQAFMDYSLNRRVQTTIGNRDIFGKFPCGVYPAKSPGTAETQGDHWIAIHVQDDDEWQGFVRALGSPAWAQDPRLATNVGREEHFREVDAHIAEYTKDQDDYDLMHRLQAVGVAATPVLEASRMFDDPHLRARDFFKTQRIDMGESFEFVGPLWKFEDTPIEFYQPPVAMGEHNEYVYRELLKVSDAEWDDFKARGWITMEFDPSLP